MKPAMKLATLPVVTLALAQCAPAAPMEPKPGIWTGQIDGREAHLCLSVDDIGGDKPYIVGRIYFAGDANIRRVDFDSQSGLFIARSDFVSDDPNTNDATLALQQGQPDRVNVFRQMNGRISRSELRTVAAANNGSCSSAEFLAPRLARLDKKVEQRSLNGLRYSRYSFDPGKDFKRVSMVGVALDGSQPGDARINARLLVNSTQWGPGDDFLSCSLHYSRSENDFQFEFATEVIYLSKKLVSVRRDYDGGCGGIHDFGTHFALIDRQTGSDIDVASWFAPGVGTVDADPIHYRAPFAPGPELQHVLSSLASGRSEAMDLAENLDHCDETGPGDPTCAFSVFLHHDGIGFVRYSEGVQMLPLGTLVVPWARIKPFLTPQAWAMLHPAS